MQNQKLRPWEIANAPTDIAGREMARVMNTFDRIGEGAVANRAGVLLGLAASFHAACQLNGVDPIDTLRCAQNFLGRSDHYAAKAFDDYLRHERGEG